jgi:hypothetical protein
VRSPAGTVLATVAIFVAHCRLRQRRPSNFFPLSERPSVLPLRSPRHAWRSRRTRPAGRAHPRRRSRHRTQTTYVGQGSPRFWLGLNPQLPNEAFAEIVIVAKDVDARERIKARVEAAVAAGALSEARVRSTASTSARRSAFPSSSG